jgi:hypothetical protein
LLFALRAKGGTSPGSVTDQDRNIGVATYLNHAQGQDKQNRENKGYFHQGLATLRAIPYLRPAIHEGSECFRPYGTHFTTPLEPAA